MKFKDYKLKVKKDFEVGYLATVLLVLFLIRLFSLLLLQENQFIEHPVEIFVMGFSQDALFALISWLILIFINAFQKQLGRKIFFFLIGCLLVFELSSNFYFLITLIPLDRTLYQFTIDDLLNIIHLFGDFKWYYLLLFLPIPMVFIEL